MGMTDGLDNNANAVEAVDIIDAKIEKIASIDIKRKLQNSKLKDDVSSTTKSNIEEIKIDNEQLGETIKENGGLLNSIKRFALEIKEFLSGSARQLETQNNLALSSNSMKSMNNQLVKISMLNHDKVLESAEKHNDSIFNKVGSEKQDIIAFENKDSSGIMRG